MLWAERKDRVFITVEVQDAKEPKVDITDEGVLTVSALSGETRYAVRLELLHPVDSKARRVKAWRLPASAALSARAVCATRARRSPRLP